MSDQLPAFVRTYIPLLVTVLGTYLAKHGLNVDGEILQVVVGAALAAAYYALVRYMESHKAWFGWALGMAKQPAYASGPAPTPNTGEDVQAVVVPDEAGVSSVELAVWVCAIAVVLILLHLTGHLG